MWVGFFGGLGSVIVDKRVLFVGFLYLLLGGVVCFIDFIGKDSFLGGGVEGFLFRSFFF